MTTYARITNDIAAEIFIAPDGVPISQCFVPEIAAQFTEVPDGTETGATFADGVWTNPAPTMPPETAPPSYKNLTVMAFYLAFHPAERMLLKALATTGIPANSPLLGGANAAIPIDPMIAEFWYTFQLAVQTGSPVAPSLDAIQAGLAYLAAPTAPTPVVLAPGRIEEICGALAS